jgi:hypothetical protein
MHGNAILHRGLQFLDRREHFLPVRPAALQEKMLNDPRLLPRERVLLAKLFEMIGQRFHLEFRDRLEHLKAVYEPFDPDHDTVDCGQGNGEVVRRSSESISLAPNGLGSPSNSHGCPHPNPLPKGERTDDAELSKAFEQLLLDANYQEMAREQIVACTEFQANRNITVKASFTDYADLRIFYRGVRHETRAFRSWHAPWRSREETVHVFARLALLVRLRTRQPESVFLKLFKNVVAEDLEMLLPYVRIRMKLFDRLKIGTSVVGSLATASWKAWTAAVLSPWVLAVVGAGFAGACVNGVTNFVASKTRYIQKLTASLYFQNLANNQSMLAHVIDSAECEQCKELLLAYFLLYVERGRDFNREQLDRRAEQWMCQHFGVSVDFDISGAVRTLIDKELVAEVCHSGPAASACGAVLKVYDLPSALHRLDEAWDECLENGACPAGGEQRLADAAWPK